jgi:hypothetical protein
VLDALVANCSVQNTASAIATFDRNAPIATVAPEQVVQWYRASSFALSLDTYNNTAALPSNAPVSNTSTLPTMSDTALPAGLNLTFLACLNATTALAVPLVAPTAKFSHAEIAGIVIGAVVGLVCLLVALSFCVRSIRRSRSNSLASAQVPFARLFGKSKTRNDRGRYESLEGPKAARSDVDVENKPTLYAYGPGVHADPDVSLDPPFQAPLNAPSYAFGNTTGSPTGRAPGYHPSYDPYEEPTGMPDPKFR